jgi:hypothetical protein
VDFRVDTHSGDLSEIDLTQPVKLRVGEMEYSPVEATLPLLMYSSEPALNRIARPLAATKVEGLPRDRVSALRFFAKEAPHTLRTFSVV